MAKKSKAKIPWGDETSIAKLAQEFLAKSRKILMPKSLADSALPSTTIPSIISEITNRVNYPGPVRVAILGCLLWGGGFLHLRLAFAASIILFLELVLGMVFFALAGALPVWMGDVILRDLHWSFPLAPSLAIIGASWVVIWWLSIVVSVEIALRRMPTAFVPTQSKIKLLFSVPFGMIAHYVQGRFWRGHVYGLFFLSAPVAALGLSRIWQAAGAGSPDDAIAMEPYFVIALSVLVIALFGVGMSWAVAFVGAFKEAGWLRRAKEETTEWMFVTLGTVVFLSIFLYVFAGRPGELMRANLTTAAAAMDHQGLQHAATLLRKPIFWWGEAALSIKAKAALFY